MLDQPSGFKKGDKVRVPKGTPFTSTHPQRKRGVLARSQTVTINHILEASVWVVGHPGAMRQWRRGGMD